MSPIPALDKLLATARYMAGKPPLKIVPTEIYRKLCAINNKG